VLRKLVVLGLLVAAIFGFYFIQGWSGAGPATRPTDVVVPRGTSLVATAALLKKAGVIRSTSRFLFQVKLFGGGRGVRAGEYEFPAHASHSAILAMLQSGKTLQRLVTIPEGLPSVFVQARLMSAPTLTGNAVMPEEGSVLPDSYSYQRGESRAAVLKRMQAAMTRTIDQLWPERSPDSAVHSKAEALILASIVEKETAKPSERPMIAGVYGNRLKAGIPLQADPTIIYPITLGKPLGRPILLSEVKARNAYNTYTMSGLPAGPIANPGRASIEAVLKPARTNALYFVADGTGGHVFAATLAEHNANVQKWRALRRERGI
jgi:UPF0755 protein